LQYGPENVEWLPSEHMFTCSRPWNDIDIQIRIFIIEFARRSNSKKTRMKEKKKQKIETDKELLFFNHLKGDHHAYSHANLSSKLLSAIPNACMAHIG
jgi:hypothetical protein